MAGSGGITASPNGIGFGGFNNPSPANIAAASGAGYQYDPNSGTYVRTPLSAGQNVNTFTNAALGGSVNGLLSAAGQAAGTSGVPGSGGSTVGVAGGSVGVPGSGGVSGGSSVGDIKPIDQTAANSATFGAAKDQAGQTGRAQIDSMKGLLGAAGMLGGGAEAAGTRDIVEQAGQGVNDVTRANAVNEAGANLDVAKTNQATQLAERGQNISAEQAQAQLAMEQAQLNSQRQLDILRSVLGFAGSATPGTPGGNQASLY